MSNNNMNTKDFLIGALIGGMVGAVSALLLAPKSGKELRHDINEHAVNVKDRSLQLKDTAVERGNEWISVAREKSSDIAKTVSKQSNQIASKVKELRSRIDENREQNSPEESAVENAGNSAEIQSEKEEVN